MSPLRPPAPRRAAARRRPATLAPALTLAMFLGAAPALAACSGSDEPDTPAVSSPAATQTASSAPAPVTTKVDVAEVTGRLSAGARATVADHVSAVVDRFLDAAFVTADYPTTDHPGAFDDFTAGAARRARDDADLLTLGDLGAQVDSVTALRRSVALDVLAVKNRAVGVTARFVIAVRTDGEVAKGVRRQGALYLAPTDTGWKVFGYRVLSGASAKAARAGGPDEDQGKGKEQGASKGSGSAKNGTKGTGR